MELLVLDNVVVAERQQQVELEPLEVQAEGKKGGETTLENYKLQNLLAVRTAKLCCESLLNGNLVAVQEVRPIN